MNHIYDILLNFNEILYDFYEWNVTDEVNHIKKIPIFKISRESLREIKENQVIFSDSFLTSIENKTEYFNGRNVKKIKHACLVTDGMEIFAIKINDYMKYSRLLIDEEMDVLEIVSRYKMTSISYEIVSSHKEFPLLTRKQIEAQNFLEHQLKLLYQEENVEKLKYIYYECFNEKCDSKEKMILKLESEKNKPDIFPKLNYFFQLSR